MKYVIDHIPSNTFLKVKVADRHRRLYFKDVKTYQKIMKRHSPSIPTFEEEIDWKGSGLTECASPSLEEREEEVKNYSI